MEDYPKVCMFDGSTKDLQVDHIDGFEENGEPENLLWLCRSCNQLKSAVYLKAGMGRRTVQYNPGILQRLFGSRETYRVHVRRPAARKTRAAAESHDELSPLAVGRYKGFTLYKRRESPGGDYIYYSTMDPDSWLDTKRQAQVLIDSFKNPAAGVAHWEHAVKVLRGEVAGSPFEAARTIRSTPIERRYQYLDRMVRANPGVPTFGQYAFAVSTHCAGKQPHCGDHDEGGAVIHATPPAKRREYADQIAAMKGKRGRARDDSRWD